MEAGGRESTRFFQAVRLEDVGTLHQMLHTTPGLARAAEADFFHYRLLNYAAWKNSRVYVDLALEHGAEIDRPSREGPLGWTPLQHALNHGHRSLAEYLIERGAEIDIHAAAGLGDTGLLKKLLTNDPALVEKRAADGQQPLHFAAHPSVARKLLDWGASLEARDLEHASTPAQWAAQGRNAVSRFLVERGAREDIFMAVCSGDPDWVKALCRDRPEVLHERVDVRRFPPPEENPEARCIYFFADRIGAGSTPLHVAAKMNRPDLITLLVEEGMDVNLRGGYDDATPLHFAAWHDNLTALGRLLELGADLDLPSGTLHQNSPLGWAVVSGAAGAVEYLLGRGAAVREFHLSDAETATRPDGREHAIFPIESHERILALLQSHQTV